jgi:ankyrin repeat protein
MQMWELIEALSIRTGNTKLDPKFFMKEEVLVSRCEGSILYDRFSGEVRFSHFTVFEYLKKHHLQNILKSVELSKVCLRYFTMAANLYAGSDELPDPLQVRRGLKFFEYAALYWGSWAEEDGHNDPEFWDLLLRFHEFPNIIHTLHLIYPFGRGLWMQERRSACEKCQDFTVLHLLALGKAVKICKLLFDITPDQNFPVLSKSLVSVSERITSFAKFVKLNIDRNCPMVGTVLNISAGFIEDRLFCLLLQKGASVDVRNLRTGSQVVQVAAGSVSKLKLLYKAGANLSSGGARNETPLHVAARHGNSDCIEFLLRVGCPIVASDDGTTPIQLAAILGDVKSLKLLITAAPHLINEQARGYYRSQSSLHLATRSKNCENLELLLSCPEIDRSIRDVDGNTPLHLAAKYGSVQHTNILLGAGADPTDRNLFGFTPLDLALLAGNTSVVQVLFWSSAVGDLGEMQTSLNPNELALHLLISRVEKDPKSGYYFAVGRLYLAGENLEMASQFFDKGSYLLSKEDGYESPTCNECHCVIVAASDVHYLCLACKERLPQCDCFSCRYHWLCDSCFQIVSTTRPPKEVTAHRFLRIPSRDYPASIWSFIESVESSNTKPGKTQTGEIKDSKKETEHRDTHN